MAILSTLFTALIAASSILSPVLAHDDHPAAMAKRAEFEIKARDSLSKCSHKLKSRAMVEHRLKKRDELIEMHLQKRRVEKRQWVPKPKPQPPSNTSEPCLLAPEVMVGPFYVKEQLIRKDIRKGEGEKGIPLLLDLQFVDVETCDPVRNAMIDVWHCNTTGIYSGFSIQNTVGESFNRGLQPTDRHGIMHMITSFPGWYPGRATHIHIGAHVGGKINRQKKIYTGGNVTHIGQVFFTEDLLEIVDTALPYTKNTLKTRLRNAQDFIFEQQNTGYDATSEWHKIGEDLSDGIIAFIQVGINLKASYDISNPGFTVPPGFSLPPGGFPSGFPTNFPFPRPTTPGGAPPTGPPAAPPVTSTAT